MKLTLTVAARTTLALCVTVLAAHLAAGTAAAQTKASIAYVPTADFTPAYVAQDKGFFAKNGLDTNLVSIPIAPTVPAAIISGSIQIGMTTPPIFLQAIGGGLDLVAVAGVSIETKAAPQMALIARKGAGITDAKSFEGRKVAVPGLQSLADASTRKWLKQNGASLDKISFIEVAMPQLIDVLRSGTVDAVAAIEPIGGAAVASGAGEMVANQLADLHEGAILTFWIASGSWAKANPQAIKGFRAAIDEAEAYIAANPDEAKKIAFKYIKREPTRFPAFRTRITVEDLAYNVSISNELGFLSSKPDLAGVILPWN